MRQFVFERTQGQKEAAGNPFCNYFLYSDRGTYALIASYDPSINIVPDGIERQNEVIKENGGYVFEMHATKSVEERFESLLRRKKAWDDGLPENMGNHLRTGAENNFTVNKEECNDIRDIPEYQLYKRLQKLK